MDAMLPNDNKQINKSAPSSNKEKLLPANNASKRGLRSESMLKLGTTLVQGSYGEKEAKRNNDAYHNQFV